MSLYNFEIKLICFLSHFYFSALCYVHEPFMHDDQRKTIWTWSYKFGLKIGYYLFYLFFNFFFICSLIFAMLPDVM